jgi:hypothetical protein
MLKFIEKIVITLLVSIVLLIILKLVIFDFILKTFLH